MLLLQLQHDIYVITHDLKNNFIQIHISFSFHRYMTSSNYQFNSKILRRDSNIFMVKQKHLILHSECGKMQHK